MKTILKLLLLPVIVFAGCTKKAERVSDLQSDTLAVPAKNYLSQEQLQDQVDKEIRGILDLANDARTADAIQIIDLTQQAVIHILDSNFTKATDGLEDAIGKAAVLTTTHPELSFFPLDVEVTTRDMVADIEYLKQVRREADRLIDRGYLQAARHLLNDMASELEIQTPMLPIATYPDALALAAKALNDGRQEDALIILNTALSTIFIETRYIPLPIIRAERMVEEVSKLLEEKDKDQEVTTLLENAEYQIRFAEALGYGKADKEFEELYTSIREIKKEVHKENAGNSINLTDTLREKLSAFKERLTDVSKSEKTDE